MLNFLKYLIPFSAILFLAQYYITNIIFEKTFFFYDTWMIYVFHVIITILIYSFLLFVSKNYFEKTGFAFMALIFIKMIASIIFLLPLIQSNIKNNIPDVAAFFISYFLFLFLETLFAVRLIKE